MFRERFGNGPWHWCVRDPDGDFGSLGGYDVYEHEDGLLSVRGELRNRERGVHWTLEHGFWQRVEKQLRLT